MTSVTDSAGVEIVHNTDAALDTTVVQLAEVLRIGMVEGPDEYQLYSVRDIAVDAAGRIFVANGGSLSIRVYSPDGRYLQEFGRAGEGPGEFRRIMMPIVWRDTVFAFDARRWQGTFFDTTGAHLASFRYDFHEWGTLPFVAATERGWVVQVHKFEPGREAASVGKALVDTTRLALLPARVLPEIAHMTFADVDTAARTIVRYPGSRNFGMRARDGGEGPVGVLMNPPFFEPQPQSAVSATGHVLIARGYPYVVDVFDLDGRHVRSIRRAHNAVAITDEHIQRLLAHVDAHYDTIGGREMNLRRRYEAQAGFPRVGYLPVTGRMLTDPAGGVWIQRTDIVADPVDVEWPRGAPPPTYWDVFDARGAFQHMIKLPPRFALRAVRDSTAYGVARDDLDVQYVVAYRLRAPGITRQQ
jgi:hypothetical protein